MKGRRVDGGHFYERDWTGALKPAEPSTTSTHDFHAPAARAWKKAEKTGNYCKSLPRTISALYAAEVGNKRRKCANSLGFRWRARWESDPRHPA